jgi:hypothetical protein
MQVEETMWDVRVNRQGSDQNDIRLRMVLARAVEERLPESKELVRVVAWSADAGGLFASRAGDRRFAVAYEVRVAA